jgi:hypothetical protein
MITKALLPPRIAFHIGAVVLGKIELNLRFAGSIEEGILIRPHIGINRFRVRVTADMAPHASNQAALGKTELNIRDDQGNPHNNRITGASLRPASR